MEDTMSEGPGAPQIVDRRTFQADLDTLRVREKAHTRRVTRLRPPAGGSPWSKWMGPRRWLANAGR